MLCKAALVACAVILAGLGGADAGDTSTSFSTQVGRPLIASLSGGAKPKGLIVYTSQGNDVATGLQTCDTATDPDLIDTCKYVGFMISCVVLGVVVFPILIAIGSCGFCCGRGCKQCACCCKPCGQEHCGGPYPSREYPLLEKLLVLGVIFPVAWVFCLAFSAVGFASLNEGSGDVQLALDGVRGIVTAPSDVLTKLDNDISNIKSLVRLELQPINDVFAKIPPIKAKVGDIRTSLNSLLISIQEVAAFVEGCKSSIPSTSCTGAILLANWNKCGSGDTLADPAGNGAALSTVVNGSNPLCKNPTTGDRVGCKCCKQCHKLIGDVSSTIAAMPADADLNKLDVQLPMGQFDSQVDSSLGDFKQPVKDMESSLGIKDTDIDALKASLSGADGILIGINVALWIPSWLALIGLLIALLLKKNGSCCWWTCYVVASFWFVIVLLPLWGILTIPATVLEGVCQILPPPRGNADVFVSLFQDSKSAAAGGGGGAQVDTKLISDLFDQCLLPTNGYLWGVVGMNKTSIKSQLSAFDVGANLNVADMTKSLRVKEYAAPFLDNSAAFQSFSAGDVGYTSSYCTAVGVGYLGPPTCSAELEGYNTNLNAKITAMKNNATQVRAALDALDILSQDLEAGLNSAINRTANMTTVLVDGMWEFGSCGMLARKYEGVYGPFCSIAHIFGSTWAASFVCGILWFIMLFTICVAKKRFRQILVPFTEEDTTKWKAGKVVHAAQVADSSMPVAMATGVPMAVAQPVDNYDPPPPPPPERTSDGPNK